MGGKGGLILLQINNTKRNKKNMSASESVEEVPVHEQLLIQARMQWESDAVQALNAKRVTKIREGADPDIEEPLMTVWNAAISDCVKEIKDLPPFIYTVI
tara:strand:+ start:37 stop:336 length:300 start_codon:yes stop_codon:yes gene_type:complete